MKHLDTASQCPWKLPISFRGRGKGSPLPSTLTKLRAGFLPSGPHTQAWHPVSQGTWQVAPKSSALRNITENSTGVLTDTYAVCAFCFGPEAPAPTAWLSPLPFLKKCRCLSLRFYAYLGLYVPFLQVWTIHHYTIGETLNAST